MVAKDDGLVARVVDMFQRLSLGDVVEDFLRPALRKKLKTLGALGSITCFINVVMKRVSRDAPGL